MNDLAEIGIKALLRLQDSARSKVNFQHILQTVKMNRKSVGDICCKK